jgi:hypothetical protein
VEALAMSAPASVAQTRAGAPRLREIPIDYPFVRIAWTALDVGVS